MTTLQVIQQLLAGELAMDPSRLEPASPLEELGIDSLTLIECMFKLEDKFGISVANGEFKVNTLQDIADLVDKLVADRHALSTTEAVR